MVCEIPADESCRPDVWGCDRTNKTMLCGFKQNFIEGYFRIPAVKDVGCWHSVQVVIKYSCCVSFLGPPHMRKKRT